NGIDRDSPDSPDEVHDAYHQVRNSTSWQLGLPKGTYSVRILIGDPTDVSSAYRLAVSTDGAKTMKVSGQATADTHWFEKTLAITIQGGPLVIANDSGVKINKIAAIDVVRMPPKLTKFSPSNGGGGSTIILTGKEFAGATSVQFNGLDAKFK